MFITFASYSITCVNIQKSVYLFSLWKSYDSTSRYHNIVFSPKYEIIVLVRTGRLICHERFARTSVSSVIFWHTYSIKVPLLSIIRNEHMTPKSRKFKHSILCCPALVLFEQSNCIDRIIYYYIQSPLSPVQP